jgi:Zn-dependent protease with chaperone function
MLAIIILLLVVGPTLAIIMLPFSLYLNLCMFITQMSLLLLSREIVNRSLREDYLNAVVYGNKRNLKTYVSYLPREGVPAFARRTLRQQEIYLAAREVYNAAPVVVQVLQAHEQGHIALGHTNWVFYLRKLRALAVAGALLVLLSFYHTLTGVSGPGAALILGGGIFLCIAPELFQFLWQGKWERGADTWAAAYVGQGNVHFVRMALRQALS